MGVPSSLKHPRLLCLPAVFVHILEVCYSKVAEDLRLREIGTTEPFTDDGSCSEQESEARFSQ